MNIPHCASLGSEETHLDGDVLFGTEVLVTSEPAGTTPSDDASERFQYRKS